MEMALGGTTSHAGVTFSTERPDAVLAANPSILGSAFNVSFSQSPAGSLVIGSDGIMAWRPNLTCPSGTYTATATYTYIGGSQTKEFSLTTSNEDMPPAFIIDHPSPPASALEQNWHGHDDDILTGPGTLDPVPDNPGLYYYGVQLSRAYDHEGPVTYDLIVESPYDSLPMDAEIDGNAYFTCKFVLPDDEYHVYQFELQATDSADKVDLRHVVLGVDVAYQGLGHTIIATNTYPTVAKDSCANRISVLHAGDGEQLLVSNGQLFIDVAPTHGALALDPNTLGGVLYTPAPGYGGLDEFYYHWEYDEFNYNSPYEKIGTASTNVSREQIQVGNWVDLVPETTYEPGKSLLAVGDSETTTLTLQNPRGDGIPAAGYWALNFERSMIRVYDGNGNEILPWSPWTGGATFLETVPYQKQITVTVVGVSAGEADLKAYWNTWACDIGQSGQREYSPWHWTTNQIVNFMVVGVDIYRGGDKITNLTSTVIVGQEIALTGVVTSPIPLDVTSKEWTIPGDDTTRVENYIQTVPHGWVVPLTSVALHSENISYYWIADGSNLVVTYTVTIVGLGSVSATTTFNVLRPTSTLTAKLTTLNPKIDLRDYGLTGRFIQYGDMNNPGITWTGCVNRPVGGEGEIAFVQLVMSDRHRIRDGIREKKTSNGIYVLDQPPDTGIFGYDGIHIGGTEGMYISRSKEIERADAPNEKLVDKETSLSVYDSFRLFLMYKPKDGIWVTLKELDWLWGFSMSSGDNGPVWGCRLTPQPDPGFDTTELPVWNGVVSHDWIPE